MADAYLNVDRYLNALSDLMGVREYRVESYLRQTKIASDCLSETYRLRSVWSEK